jgi:hypothetical protein
MLILCDRKMPAVAKKELSSFGEIVEFATEGITYPAISGHPDIFFCPSPTGLIVAPNLPENYFKILDQRGIPYKTGRFPVGQKYPESARYNALFAGDTLIHNPETSDASLLELNPDFEIIPVKQGYTRCNLVSLSNYSFITSDHGIEKTLKQRGLEVLFIDSTCVRLEGFDHGFYGGACGLNGNSLFLSGSLTYFKEPELIKQFTEKAGIRIIELYEGPPIDVGTILFLDN